MTDEKRPPRLPRVVTRNIGEPGDEEVFIPESDQSQLIPKAPKPPAEPFNLVPRPPRLVDVSASVTEILDTQRKMARQLDGFGASMNTRFNIFHEELSMLRQVVTKDHAPRIERVEEMTAAEKTKRMAVVGGKYSAYFVAFSVLARLVAKAYPQLGSSIEDLLGALGL